MDAWLPFSRAQGAPYRREKPPATGSVVEQQFAWQWALFEGEVSDPRAIIPGTQERGNSFPPCQPGEYPESDVACLYAHELLLSPLAVTCIGDSFLALN